MTTLILCLGMPPRIIITYPIPPPKKRFPPEITPRRLPKCFTIHIENEQEPHSVSNDS